MCELREVEAVVPRCVVVAEEFREHGVVVRGRRCGARSIRHVGDFVLYDVFGDASAVGERGHAHDHRVEIAEVAVPRRRGGERELEEAGACLLAERHVLVRTLRILQELVVEVRLDVFAAFGESGHLEAPEVDAGEEVAAELATRHVVHEIAVRTADELEVAVFVLGGAEGAVVLLLDCLEKHRLGLHRQLADFIEEDDAAVGLLEETGVVGAGAGEGSLPVSEERGLRKVAAERGAVYGHEGALDLPGLFLEQVYLLGELALARAGGAGEKDGVGGAHGHALDRLDEPVEGGVARGDALLEEGEVFLAFGLEALGEHVVAREVEVDHVDNALGVVRVADVSLLRRGLHDLRVEVVRLDEQEEASFSSMLSSMTFVSGETLLMSALMRSARSLYALL